MNQPGRTTQFEYQESPGVFRTAKLKDTYFIEFPPATSDAEWLVLRFGEDTWQGDFQWLSYLGTDGQNWKTRTHCHWDGARGVIKVGVESERDNGEGNNSNFEIVDWGGIGWKVVLDRVITSKRGQIHFTLSPVQGGIL